MQFCQDHIKCVCVCVFKSLLGNLPAPLNWLLARVIVLFLPFATGGANICGATKGEESISDKSKGGHTSHIPFPLIKRHQRALGTHSA